MKALVYDGPRSVSVRDVPDAGIERPTDVLVRITTTNICGSDLHMYEGRTGLEAGKILGHENMGEVVEVGAGVDRVRVGDQVSLPFNIGCGFCTNCERGNTGFCLTVNPGTAGGAYGFYGMGPYAGGQAELLRVPYGDFNCLVLPEDAAEKQNDYTMLSDIYPIDYGTLWFKGQRVGNGQANVKNYNRQLAELIHRGKATPSFIVSHELSLAEAPDAYQSFDDRLEGWTKVLLKPAA